MIELAQARRFADAGVMPRFTTHIRKADILEPISNLRSLQRELGWVSSLSIHACPAARFADALDVPVICSTAAAEDRDLRMSA